jgi:hypothetical protein
LIHARTFGSGGESVCGLSKRGRPGRRIAACTRQPFLSCHCHAATAVPSAATSRRGWVAECERSEMVTGRVRAPPAVTKAATGAVHAAVAGDGTATAPPAATAMRE